MSATLWSVALVASLGQAPGGDRDALDQSEPILCRTITGYEQYEALPEPVVARTEKLLIYTRPSGHGFVREGAVFRFHLVQDVNVRRKGQKKVLWGRKRVVEYEGTSPRPPTALYLATSLGLKEFEPGEYEAELILHDEIGKSQPVRSTLSFRLIDPPKATNPRSDPVTPPEEPRPPLP